MVQIFFLLMSTMLRITDSTVMTAVMMIAGRMSVTLFLPVHRSILSVSAVGRNFFILSAMPMTDIAKYTLRVQIVT